MDKFVISGIAPAIDGEYEFDMAELVNGLNNREWHIIKQVSGVRRGEFREAIAAGDNDVMVALTMIVLRRNGKQLTSPDILWDAGDGQLTFVDGDLEEKEDLPPTPPPTSDV